MRYIGVVIFVLAAAILNAEERVDADSLYAVQNASADPYVYASSSAGAEAPDPLILARSPNARTKEKVQALEAVVNEKILPNRGYASMPALVWIFGSVVAGFFAMLSTGSLPARKT